MCRFIETISVKEGKLLHMADHQKRMESTISHFYGPENLPELESTLIIPEKATTGWYKCRIIYRNKIEQVTWEPYQVREISSLALIHADNVEYSWKYADRSVFEELIRQAGTDDIIIVKDGYITDSSYANLIFHRGHKWITPSTPLLHGTQRKRLIESGTIKEDIIRPKDLQRYDRVKFINAIMDMKTGPEYALDNGQLNIKENESRSGN